MKITKSQLKEMIREAIVKELGPKLPSTDPNDKRPDWEIMLNTVARVAAPLGWTISPEWANDIIKHFRLIPTQNRGDMTGEVSALFKYKGAELRLKKEFPNRWKVYRGAWNPDPRWSGD